MRGAFDANDPLSFADTVETDDRSVRWCGSQPELVRIEPREPHR